MADQTSSTPEGAGTPQGSGKKPLVPVLIGLLVVAVGVIVFLVVNNSKPKVEVPDVVFKERAEAEAALAEVGLKLGTITERADEKIQFGDIVLETSPKAGTQADQGATVDVVVSTGPKLTDEVEVPDLKGLTPAEAEKKLFDALFIPQPGDQVYSDDVEAGKVCAQSVKAGTKATVLSTVTYSVSLGKEQVEVPDVTGKTADEARGELDKVGLSVDTIKSYSDKVAKDKVISQDKKAGDKVNKGTTVTLEISMGAKPATKVLVPVIYSYDLDDAIRAIESAGLKYKWSGDEDGTVVSIKPAPNTQVDQGSTVEFVLKNPRNSQPTTQSQNNNNNSSNDSGNNSVDGGNDNVDNGNVSDDNDGDDDTNVPLYSKEECMQTAFDTAGAGGAATGDPMNVDFEGPIDGGGTVYYAIEFDLGDAHFEMMVDATTNTTISGTMYFDGHTYLIDSAGNQVLDE
jgi:serine/threonine-protein kinase